MSVRDPKRRLADWFRQWRVPLRKFLLGRSAVPAADLDDVRPGGILAPDAL